MPSSPSDTEVRWNKFKHFFYDCTTSIGLGPGLDWGVEYKRNRVNKASHMAGIQSNQFDILDHTYFMTLCHGSIKSCLFYQNFQNVSDHDATV